MRIGTILLSQDNYYLSGDGNLPERYSWDKPFITTMAKDKIILASENTAKMIPPSIRKVCKSITTDINDDWDVNYGIKTFNEDMDMFFIVRSPEYLKEGKYFDINRIKDKYNLLLKLNEIEIWIK